MAKKGFKEYLPVLIPLIVAIVVVSTLAVSGKITSKTAESAQPTVTQDAAVEEVDDTPKDSKVTIVAVGDNLIHNTLIDSGKQQDGSLDYNSFYDEIKKYIEPADIAVIDQETVLGGKDFPYTGYPVFNSPWEIGEAAINAGFDVFTCANNHILDMGSKGIENEQKFFSKYPEIVQIGTNASEDDYNKITYYEKNGITFSLLNYTYGTNGIPLPEDKPYIVNMLDKEKVTKDIKEARKNSDVVMVFPHWGTENSHDVNEQQKEYVKLFSDLGVDIVIGCHPHVLQPYEMYTAANGNQALVYYSLGNFISAQDRVDSLLGGMATVTLQKTTTGPESKVEIIDYDLKPLVTHVNYGTSFTTYYLEDYSDYLGSYNVLCPVTTAQLWDRFYTITGHEPMN